MATLKQSTYSLTYGADINAIGGQEVATTALIVAAFRDGRTEIARLLVGRGADIQCHKRKMAQTALIEGCRAWAH
jgi:hypothetical protein